MNLYRITWWTKHKEDSRLRSENKCYVTASGMHEALRELSSRERDNLLSITLESEDARISADLTD